jgi:hypothetical protein
MEKNDHLALTDAVIYQRFGGTNALSLRFNQAENYEYTCEDTLKPSLLLLTTEHHVPLTMRPICAKK